MDQIPPRTRTPKIVNAGAHGLGTERGILGKSVLKIQHQRTTLGRNHICLKEVVVQDEVSEAAEAEVTAEVSDAEGATIMAMDPQVEDTNTQAREAEVNKEQVVPSTARTTIKTNQKIILTMPKITKIIPMEIGMICIIKVR